MRLWQKKLAIIAAMNKGYLLDVSGNPDVLAAALAKPLQGVTVYGASGGVGDSSLPSGYIPLEYIESTGTQYIDTGISIDNTCGFYIDAQKTGTGDRMAIGVKGNNDSRWIYNVSDTNIAISWNTVYSASSEGLSERHKAYLNFKNNRKRVLDGAELDPITAPLSVVSNMGSVCLFAARWAGTPSLKWIGKIYAAQITKGEAVIANYIPAKRSSDDVVGMYDTMNDVFYTNSGTGDFVAGGEIYKIPVLMGELNVPGYTQLEYIESSGTQYIDTGVYIDDTCGFYIDAQKTDTSDSIAIGVRGVSVSSRWVANPSYSSLFLSWNDTYSVRIDGNIRWQAFMNYKNDRKRIVNGIEMAPITATLHSDASDFTVCLFAAKWGGETPSLYLTGKIYKAQITRGDSIIVNLIPAKRNSDGEIGMYDTVTSTFFTNSGTGSFIAGAEVPNKTINLYTPQQLTNETDAFAVNIPAKTATLTAGGVSTDVSDIQDWEQDFTLAKGDNTVSIGTTMQPSAVEWRYLSSSRG